MIFRAFGRSPECDVFVQGHQAIPLLAHMEVTVRGTGVRLDGDGDGDIEDAYCYAVIGMPASS